LSAQSKRRSPQALIHVAALLPLLWLAAEGLINGWGFNPVQTLEHRTGDWALILLLASLTCTPLRTLTGWSGFTRFRRPLGVYAFGYATLHLLVFLILDYGLEWAQILDLLLNKLYLWLGLAAFLILIALAVTSTTTAQRKMKKNWNRLHSLVYPLAILVILHFTLSLKGDLFRLSGQIFWPLVALGVWILLMALRLPALRKWISRVRQG
jgi:sulfoxide reductase heme-binding subunit YedZ